MNRNCPKCKGSVDSIIRVYADKLGTCVIKCRKCGREWGIGAFDYTPSSYYQMASKAELYLKKWNEKGE